MGGDGTILWDFLAGLLLLVSLFFCVISYIAYRRSGVRISGATLSYHLKRMVKRGVVKEEVCGREKRHTVENPEEVVTLLVTYRRSSLTPS